MERIEGRWVGLNSNRSMLGMVVAAAAVAAAEEWYLGRLCGGRVVKFSRMINGSPLILCLTPFLSSWPIKPRYLFFFFF